MIGHVSAAGGLIEIILWKRFVEKVSFEPGMGQ